MKLAGNSTQKKAHSTKKKTHEALYRFRSFVLDDVDGKKSERIRSRKERPDKENDCPLLGHKTEYLIKDIVEGVDNLIIHRNLIMKMRTG